jgi:hypothetical protein
VVDEAWDEVARAVGLTLAHVADAHVTGTTFEALRREMKQGRAAAGAPGTTPWLHGERRDVAVIVRPLTLGATPAARSAGPTHIAAVAQIDPPLFAGLRMYSRDLVALFGVAQGDVPTGHPALDPWFLTFAFDPARVRELLLPGGLPDGLGEAISHARFQCSVLVKDSAVEAIGAGASGASRATARIDGLVDIATRLAREISTRARTLRQTPLEQKARDAWQHLAATLGLSVDPLRWHIFGRLRDVDVSVTLEGSPPAVSTSFRARLRSRLPVPLFLRRGFRENAWSAPPPMGFPELDALLVLQTADHERARAVLADPSLRALLVEEATTSNLVLDDRAVVLGRGGFASTREIAHRLEALVAIVDRLTPPLPAAGPFR